jgi:pimeloyl-ACP methyl ester carboxylesterase
MVRVFGLALGLLLAFAGSALAYGEYPKGFRTEEIKTNGTTLHVRVGGHGPNVVLLHGFGDTGDMWAPLAKALMADHTVIVPDLRGMGLSAHRLHQEEPGAGHRRRDGCTEGRARGSRHA